MGGYSACKKEFEGALRKITMLGYGIVLIAHSAARTEKTADGSEVEIISPEMPKRAAEICNGLVDIIGPSITKSSGYDGIGLGVLTGLGVDEPPPDSGVGVGPTGVGVGLGVTILSTYNPIYAVSVLVYFFVY